MPRVPALAVALTILFGAVSVAAADTIGSVYTSVADKDCRKVSNLKLDGDDYAAERTCRGLAGLVVVKNEDDLRETITVGRSASAADKEPAASQGFGPFNSTTNTIEWRVIGGKPFAMIQRWHIADNDDPEKNGRPKSKQMLVVTRLPPGAVCHVAYIDVTANPDANEIARKAAGELARGFDCSKDKISVIGIGGRATALAMASRNIPGLAR
ncbi:hypothetical protein [Tardiphaga sp. 839_C3_N1_4]|uniref:hypothetical protein n=1 Tax=Tardiphaga sp. 839_C3_N1_4 TaxID=3240761 RepID=UPI003F250527